MASLALRFAPHIIIALAVISVIFYVRHLQTKVVEQEVTIKQQVEQHQILQKQVNDLTISRADLEESLKKAEGQREKIRADLQATLRKLSQQKPPVECSKAVEWAVDRKGDLAW